MPALVKSFLNVLFELSIIDYLIVSFSLRVHEVLIQKCIISVIELLSLEPVFSAGLQDLFEVLPERVLSEREKWVATTVARLNYEEVRECFNFDINLQLWGFHRRPNISIVISRI